jgi:hypothetical protein
MRTYIPTLLRVLHQPTSLTMARAPTPRDGLTLGSAAAGRRSWPVMTGADEQARHERGCKKGRQGSRWFATIVPGGWAGIIPSSHRNPQTRRIRSAIIFRWPLLLVPRLLLRVRPVRLASIRSQMSATNAGLFSGITDPPDLLHHPYFVLRKQANHIRQLVSMLFKSVFVHIIALLLMKSYMTTLPDLRLSDGMIQMA